MLRLYNFFPKTIEEFKPISKVVSLYTCGPTVYDYVHIGNWRTFVFEDILKRVLVFNGYKVNHVMNITDIDDKIIATSRNQRIAFSEIAQKYERAFFEDLEKLNILKADVYPRATEHIDSMIQIIELLLEKGFAYKSDDGIYFDISKFKEYGKLSNLSKRKIKEGARVAADLYEKDNPADFALWKFSKKVPAGPVSDFPPASAPQPFSSIGDSTSISDSKKGGVRAVGSPSVAATRNGNVAGDPSWKASFGEGRPGWHIECSAMSMKYLGDPSAHSTSSVQASSGRKLESFRTIDIHTGGVDLLFPHHENEMAQSEAATSKKFVNFWLEGEHLLVEGQKMAKSMENIFTVADIVEKGFDSLALRYLFLTAHYRSKLNFTWGALAACQNALDNLRSQVSTWDEPKIGCAEFEGNFKKAVNNDLDIPKALSIMWAMVKSNYPTSAKHQSILVMDKVLGLGLGKFEKMTLPKGAEELIEKRENLRKQGKFKESDKLRKDLQRMGVYVEDTASGPKWKVKS